MMKGKMECEHEREDGGDGNKTRIQNPNTKPEPLGVGTNA